ncbi:hypothetical protein HYQ59_1873 [Lactobacillus crispatus]|uniref:hypothetical protein n=1 Tax=Lactobacillus crispatus TaxID=47770 RepID=UPI0018E36FC8|nr:hypothetical protein [Lactobacillus crispatus]MBI1700521.1 hypothetical protein [Lactobacillus crispatus]
MNENKEKQVKNDVVEIQPEKKNEKDLQKIEDKFATIIESERKNWIACFKMMQEVHDKELWYGNYKNFTAWVKHVADENKYSESVLWSRYSAGLGYLDFKRNNSKLPELDDVKGSPDSINLVVRIVKNTSGYEILTNDKIKNLISEVAKGDISRRELQKVNKQVNRRRIADNQEKEKTVKKQNEDGEYITNVVAAKALKQNHSWLKAGDNDKNRYAYYRVLNDIVVNDAKTKKIVNLNLIVLENLRQQKQKNDEVTVNGITFMNRKTKFEKTKSNCRIAEMCDRFWLLVPQELKKDALAYLKKVNKQWGVLILKKEKEDDDFTISLVQDPSEEHMGDSKLKIITACLTTDPADVGGNLHTK